MTIKDSSFVLLESLLQIYAKDGKSRRLRNKKRQYMELNQKLIRDLSANSSSAARNIIQYCILNMSTKDDEFETMSIKLDFNDDECSSAITKNRNSFYSAIKELLEAKFLMKWSPKVYLVDHEYISCLTDLQVDKLLNDRYKNIQRATPGTWLYDLLSPSLDELGPSQ